MGLLMCEDEEEEEELDDASLVMINVVGCSARTNVVAIDIKRCKKALLLDYEVLAKNVDKMN